MTHKALLSLHINLLSSPAFYAALGLPINTKIQTDE